MMENVRTIDGKFLEMQICGTVMENSWKIEEKIDGKWMEPGLKTD